MMALWVEVLLGVVLGARHAFEPDHLAAVSVLAADGPRPWKGALLGGLWGLGHSLALLGVGLVLGARSARMPEELADLFELGVAVMLLALGLGALRRALREGRAGMSTRHRHEGSVHDHAGPVRHLHIGPWTLAARPLLVGSLHGLAGSGALTALVVAKLPTLSAQVAFIVLFGLGAMLGMAALSGLAGWQLARLSRSARAARAVYAVTGVLSMCLGVVWGWPLLERML